MIENIQNRFHLLSLIVAVGFLGMATPAAASPLIWTLSGVAFDDAGTASGSFVFDADTGTVSNWNISVAGGNTTDFPPVTYDTSSATGTYYSWLTVPYFDFAIGSRQLRIKPTSPLTNAGGAAALDLANINYNLECFNCSPARIIAKGALVSAPEPGAFTLHVAALLALGVITSLRRL